MPCNSIVRPAFVQPITSRIFSLRLSLSTMSPGGGTKREADENPASSRKEHKFTSRDFVPRYTGPPESEMTPKQRNIRDSILKSRPRTGLSGPFGPWLSVPEIAEPSQELGRVCRYGTSLSFAESELVILLTGAKFKSHTEFDIHTGEAIKAGLTMDVINAIPRDDEFSLVAVQEMLLPLLEGDDRKTAVVNFAVELLDKSAVSDGTYEAAKAALGGKDSTLVEITSIIGYYAFVSFTLNVFRIPSSSC